MHTHTSCVSVCVCVSLCVLFEGTLNPGLGQKARPKGQKHAWSSFWLGKFSFLGIQMLAPHSFQGTEVSQRFSAERGQRGLSGEVNASMAGINGYEGLLFVPVAFPGIPFRRSGPLRALNKLRMPHASFFLGPLLA